MYTTLDTWDALIDQLKKTDDPQCFTVNYLPDEEKYALWIGNQPYSTYDELLDQQEIDTTSLRKERNDLRKQVADLQTLVETYADRDKLIENGEEVSVPVVTNDTTEVIRDMLHGEMKRMLEGLTLQLSVTSDEKK